MALARTGKGLDVGGLGALRLGGKTAAQLGHVLHVRRVEKEAAVGALAAVPRQGAQMPPAVVARLRNGQERRHERNGPTARGTAASCTAILKSGLGTKWCVVLRQSSMFFTSISRVPAARNAQK